MKSKLRFLSVLMFFVILVACTFVFNSKEVNADVLDSPESVIFESLGHEIGLSNLSVSSIVQDKYGFMWFGTQGGLNMYNSNEIMVYSHNPFDKEGLLNNLIQTMYYDEVEHVIWIGTYQGLSRFDIDTKTFINYTTNNSELSNEIIVSITKDASDNIWFGTLDGLNMLDITTNHISTYEVPGDVIRDLVFDSNGNLLIGTYQGLCMFNSTTETVEQVDISLPSDYVMVMGEFNEGILTIGMWDGGVVEISLDTFEVLEVVIEEIDVYSLLQSEDGSLYIGTWGDGLYVSKSGTETHHFESDGGESQLAHPIVYSIFEDEVGLIWLGTNGGGISLINNEKTNKVIHTYDENDNNSIMQGKINEIFIDNDIFYFAIYNEGLNIYNETQDTMEFYQYIEDDPTSLANNNVNTIIHFDENQLLLGTNGGIEIYNKTTKQFSRSDILPESHIVYALVLQDELLWIGTYQNGVYVYDYENDVLTHLSSILESDETIDSLIYDIYIDTSNRIWIGSNNGLVKLIKENDGYNYNIYINEGYDYDQLGSDIIKVIFEDDDNVIWIGTNGGGVSRYNEDGTFTTYTSAEGISGNIVNGINQDSKGYIWIATQRGISKFDSTTETVVQYNTDDGIGGYTFTSNITYHENMLYFGGNHGIVAVPENYSSTGLEVPKVYITSIDVLQESLNSTSQIYNNMELELSYNENSIGFQVDALNYQKSSSVIMSYKLIGYDDEYIEFSDSTYVHYSNLPPGDYTFSIISSLTTTSQEQTAEVHFTIAKPWFRTVVAYIVYGLIIIGFSYLGIVLWEARVFKLKNKQLQIMNSKLELLTIEDPLTKAYNRRYFKTNFQDLLGIAKRSKITFSVMLLDIDDFKLVNNKNGHLAGDEVLIEMVRRAKSVLKRSTDFIARIGGDEFVILMFDTNSTGARLLSQKVKRAIEVSMDYGNLDIKISAGVVTIKPTEDITINKIIELADKQLYQSKDKGKNQISYYDTEIDD